jgi:hypothetical protein
MLEREVAVKEVLLPGGLPASERAELVARTTREARAAARLNHRGVITIHDVVEHEGAPWIVMEFITGRSLSGEMAAAGGRLPWQRVADIGAQIAAALTRAHAAGIVHRDLKPDNVLLDDDRVVVTDFGIARVADAATKLTAAGTVMGTPQYMAPEQLEGHEAGPAADMWALGATLYAAAEGRPPFDGSTLTAILTAVLTKDPAPPAFSGPLTPVLASLLTKSPDARPSASLARQELRAALTGQPVPAPQPLAGSSAPTALSGSGNPSAGPQSPPLGVPAMSLQSPALGVPAAGPESPALGVPAAGPESPALGVPVAGPESPALGVPVAGPESPALGVPVAGPESPALGVPVAGPESPALGVPVAAAQLPAVGVPTPAAPDAAPPAIPSQAVGGSAAPDQVMAAGQSPHQQGVTQLGQQAGQPANPALAAIGLIFAVAAGVAEICYAALYPVPGERAAEIYTLSSIGLIAAIAALATLKRPRARWVSSFTQGLWAVTIPALAWLALSWHAGEPTASVFQMLGFVAGVFSVFFLLAASARAMGGRRSAARPGLLIPVLLCAGGGWLLWTIGHARMVSATYSSWIGNNESQAADYLLAIAGAIVAVGIVVQAFRLADRGQGGALVGGWSVAAFILLLIFNTGNGYLNTYGGNYILLNWIAALVTLAGALLGIVYAARKDAAQGQPTAS